MCSARVKFNTLNFARLYCAIGAAAELKGKMAKFYLQNFTRARIYRAKFHAIAEFLSMILSGF